MDHDNQLKNLANKYSLSIFPEKEFTLAPRESIDLEIRFNPKTRLHQFKQELFYQIVENKETRKLLNVTACCHGIELKLLENTAGFGPVVINSKLTKKYQIVNLGDIHAKFNWETDKCKRYFTVHPQSGVLPAHEDSFFEITFHPDAIDNNYHFKVKCDIEDSEPLYMDFVGKGVPQTSSSTQNVEFKAFVRESDKKKVTISNPTAIPWRIRAVISSHLESSIGYFSGKEILEVPANNKVEYEIVYSPLSMTKTDQAPQIKEEVHEGSLFFATPDGNALLYNLTGKALPPNPQGTIEINDIKAKKNYPKSITIKNWLKSSQRFNVKWEVAGDDPAILIKGANTIDIMGDSSKDYKLFITCLKPGAGKVTLTLKNETTGEFLFYKLVRLDNYS